MLYLIGQILLCLLVAAAIGFVVGWLVRSIGEGSRAQALEGTWRSRLRAVELERADLQRRLADSGVERHGRSGEAAGDVEPGPAD